MLEICKSQVAIKPLRKDSQVEIRGNQFTNVRNLGSEHELYISTRN